MAAKKQKPLVKGGILQKNQYFAIVGEEDLADTKEIYEDDPGTKVGDHWTPEKVITDFLSENFNHRSCNQGNCNLSEERLQNFTLAEKKATLKVLGYRLIKMTIEEL